MKTVKLNESQLRHLIHEIRGDLQVGDIVTVVPEYQHPVRVRVQEFIGDMRTVTTDAEPGEAFLGVVVSDADVPWAGGGDFDPGDSFYFYVSEIEPDSWESGFFAESQQGIKIGLLRERGRGSVIDVIKRYGGKRVPGRKRHPSEPTVYEFPNSTAAGQATWALAEMGYEAAGVDNKVTVYRW